MQLLQTFFRIASGSERILLSHIHDIAMSNSDSQNYKQKVYRNTTLNLVSYSCEDLCYHMLVLSFISIFFVKNQYKNGDKSMVWNKQRSTLNLSESNL
jgi:hypothetical protein